MEYSISIQRRAYARRFFLVQGGEKGGREVGRKGSGEEGKLGGREVGRKGSGEEGRWGGDSRLGAGLPTCVIRLLHFGGFENLSHRDPHPFPH